MNLTAVSSDQLCTALAALDAVDLLGLRLLKDHLQQLTREKLTQAVVELVDYTGRCAEALERLRAGNERFVRGTRTADPGGDQARRAEVVAGQAPFAVVLGCSDSRVPPEILFDQGIGDLFVVRVAGNIATPSQVESVAFAVLGLGARLVVVLGHSSCGAVGAVASDAKLDGHMSTFVPPIQAAIKNVKDLEGDLVNNAAKELAKQMADKIADSEPIVADHVKSGKTKVVPAYYDLHSGDVTLLN